jgi:hypothetical protein
LCVGEAPSRRSFPPQLLEYESYDDRAENQCQRRQGLPTHLLSLPGPRSTKASSRLGDVIEDKDAIAPIDVAIRYAKIHGIAHRPWLTALLARRPTKVAAIALANKLARMAWAMMAKGELYKEPAALAA